MDKPKSAGIMISVTTIVSKALRVRVVARSTKVEGFEKTTFQASVPNINPSVYKSWGNPDQLSFSKGGLNIPERSPYRTSFQVLYMIC